MDLGGRGPLYNWVGWGASKGQSCTVLHGFLFVRNHESSLWNFPLQACFLCCKLTKHWSTEKPEKDSISKLDLSSIYAGVLSLVCVWQTIRPFVLRKKEVKYDTMCGRILDDRTDKFTYLNVFWRRFEISPRVVLVLDSSPTCGQVVKSRIESRPGMWRQVIGAWNDGA